jgi:hypothetical protein
MDPLTLKRDFGQVDIGTDSSRIKQGYCLAGQLPEITVEL